MTLTLVVGVVVGGAVGVPARYLLDRAINHRIHSNLPWGIFAVNALGSFILGVLTGLALDARLSGVDKALLATGFCGAFTTFSTFTFETVRLFEEGQVLRAITNVAGSVTVGLALAAAGMAIGLAY